MTDTNYKTWTHSAVVQTPSKTAPYWLHFALLHPGQNTSELFHCGVAPNGAFIVSALPPHEKLALTEKSRAAMLKELEQQFMEGMDPESWLSMTEASLKYK